MLGTSGTFTSGGSFVESLLAGGLSGELEPELPPPPELAGALPAGGLTGELFAGVSEGGLFVGASIVESAFTSEDPEAEE